MLVRVLGPVELCAAEDVIVPGGPKPKALLAALTVHARQVVSIDRLVDLIWDDTPPSSAMALVHQYVSQVRRGFAAAGARAALTTRAPGYLLALDPAQIDVEVFGQQVRAAGDAEQAGDPARAAAAYERALDLWRGPAFCGVDTRFARNHAAGLEAQRLTAAEGLARCQLGLGQVGAATARLTELTAAHPLREESRGLLMRALYLSGRPADAMAVYREGREHLVDELGVEPGAALQQLYAQLLDGTLAEPAPAESRPAPFTPAPAEPRERTTVPNQLPPDLPDFTGRAEQIDAVVALARSGRPTPTVVVSGSGGAGKSTLATHCAHLLAAEYPDGQLFADLHGHDAAGNETELLGRFLRALGVPAVDLPDEPDERTELYRTAVADRRMIIVLDNARSERQVRRLLPGSGSCMVLITSRSRLTGIAGAEPLELDYLSPTQSVEMLGRIIGADRVASDPAAAARIAELCGGVPLAVRVAGAKLLARSHWPLRTLANRLSDERHRLDELVVGDLAIRSSLELSHTELEPLPRRAFHLLALLDLPDFGSWIAVPLLDVSPFEAEDVVEQLVDLRLVEVSGVDALGRVRYRLHDLVRLFGAEQAAVHEPADLVTAAATRTLAMWMTLIEIGASRLPRVTLGLRPTPPARVEVDADLAAEVLANPVEWLKAETAAVVRTVERAHGLGIDELTTTLISVLLSSPFAVRNEFDGWHRTHQVALAAARDSGNAGAEATILAGLGQLYYEKDDFTAAEHHFEQALDQARALGDRAVEIVALIGIGTVDRDRGELADALTTLTTAAELARAIDDQGMLAAATYGIGVIRRDRGELAAAAEDFTAIIEIYRSLGDQRGEALALRGLSLCRRAAGDPVDAAALSRQAMAILERADDILGATYAAQSLAKALLRTGDLAAVPSLLADCLETCNRQRDQFGVALVTRTLGEYALAAGDLEAAVDRLTDALAQWTELGLPLWQARTLRDLAAARSAEAEALALWERAIELFAHSDAREAGELASSSPGEWLAAVQTYRKPVGSS
jgi:DNA-binding SARP family transcriptional activator/tetratricopeptide (TPR) repeat protein